MTQKINSLQVVSLAVFLFLAFGLIFVLQAKDRTQIIKKESQQKQEEELQKTSPLSGLICNDYDKRPMAVVLAEDPVTRPLSGLFEADLVFEIPVITNEINRLLAFYVCGQPEEIGSLRSARHDFVPLAMGLDAILAHWGGSHYALDLLDNQIMDNINALINPHNAFYRKIGVPQPHNGFTSVERLRRASRKLGYRTESSFEGYPHLKNPQAQIEEEKTLTLNYTSPYNISYHYQPSDNSYLRFRDGRPEIDTLVDKQIEAKVVIVMKAESRQIEGPYYNDVDIEGDGDCQIFQNGQVLNCYWQKNKDSFSSKLYFLNEAGQEIKLVPGQIWVEVVESDQEVNWQ